MVVRVAPAPKSSTSTSTNVQWERAPNTITRRHVMVEVYGDTFTGRSTFALTAPGPIAYIHTSEKWDVVTNFAEQKQIEMVNCGGAFLGSDEQNEAHAREVLNTLKAAWVQAFSWAKTIIIDTHYEAWQIARIAYFGALKPDGGRIERNYDPINAEFGSLVNLFRLQKDTQTNVILVGQTQDEYTKPKEGQGQRTGKTVRATSFKQVPVKADVVVRTYSELRQGRPVYKSVLEKAWIAGHMLGTELEGDMSTFPNVMSLITGTDPEEWGG